MITEPHTPEYHHDWTSGTWRIQCSCAWTSLLGYLTGAAAEAAHGRHVNRETTP